MNILILNGSPKGKYSITLQTCMFLVKHHPEHHFETLHVGQKIRSIAYDFSEAAEMLSRADFILFSYPVYTFLAPSQLHRFIALLKEHPDLLQGKWATQITTSKHFYDTTAHRCIEQNCLDLGLRTLKGLSADMDDLLSERGQHEALAFFDFKLWEIANHHHLPFPAQRSPFAGIAPAIAALSAPRSGKRIALVADLQDGDAALKALIDLFRQRMPYQVDVVNIGKFDFKGGCISCFHCSADGHCIYNDGFEDLLRKQIQTADATVYAFTIQDHSMGWRFKTYDDRQFCNGHRTVTMGKPTGYLVSGPYAEEHNLQTVIEGRAQVGGNYLCGVATNEQNPNEEVERLCQTLVYALDHHYRQPANFLGVGGMKIFRDLIYLMRGLMRADHRFFKSHGQYDFPQKRRLTSWKMYLVGWLMNNKRLRAKMGNKINEGMIAPYKKVLDKQIPPK